MLSQMHIQCIIQWPVFHSQDQTTDWRQSTFVWHQGPTTTTLWSSCESWAFQRLCPHSTFTYMGDSTPSFTHLGGQGACGCGLLNLTCNHLTSASSQPGDELKIVVLRYIVETAICCSKGLALDDDDDNDEMASSHLSVLTTLPKWLQW